jgi:pimeloyl-ACP methyl ester carboxylesterase
MMLKLVELGWGRENPAFRQVYTTMFIPESTPEQFRWFTDLQRMSTSAENAVGLIRGFDAMDVTDLLPKINCPTLVLHARNDARVPFGEGRMVASSIAGAEFVPLESRNHILWSTSRRGNISWPRSPASFTVKVGPRLPKGWHLPNSRSASVRSSN